MPLVAAATRLLAAHGPSAIGAVLALTRDALGCADVVLRGPGGEAAHRSGPDVPAQPSAHRWTLDVPCRSRGRLRGLVTAVSDHPFGVEQGGALATIAELLALVLDVEDATGARAAGRAVLDHEADQSQLAAALLDQVGESLVTIRYTAELVTAGRLAPEALNEAVRAAIAGVRHAHRDLRSHALQSGVRTALHELSARLAGDRPADGRPAMRVQVYADDPALEDLPPSLAVIVERVAEAALRGSTGVAVVHASADPSGVKLRVDSADIAYDASELQRWGRRAATLGGHLTMQPTGVELHLPRPDPSVQPEGHHDNRPDLRRPSTGP